MDYKEIKDLINSTLMGKELGHEIQPQEHQDMAQAILDFARSVEVIGQSVIQGFATADTVPEQPDNARICYISICSNNETTVFTNFLDENSEPISATCTQFVVKAVVLLWNGAYWEKMEQGVDFEESVRRNINGGNAQGLFI